MGKGQRPSQTEDRRRCVMVHLSVGVTGKTSQSREDTGEGKARRIRWRRRIRRFILNLPRTGRDSPRAAGYSVSSSQRRMEKWMAAHPMFDSTAHSKAGNHWRGCRSEQHLIDRSTGQETGTRQGLYKETHVSDYIICAEAVKGLCEVCFSLGEQIFLLRKLKWGTTEGPISRFGGVIRVDMCYDMAVCQLPHLDPESGSEEGERRVYETEWGQVPTLFSTGVF